MVVCKSIETLLGRFRRITMWVASCAISVAVTLSASWAADEPDFDGFAGYAEQALDDWRTPGMTVAVVHGGEVILTTGYGVRKQGTDKKVDEDTMFALGSTSKAFAAATVALLVDREEISFDDRVKVYLPWFEIYDARLSNMVNVRDLLTHRIGTSYADENELRPGSVDAKDHLLRSRDLVKPVAPFRDRYVYSNNMFIASGQLVAAVSGKTWPEFAKENLWAPLKMKSTNADAVAARRRRNAASPHRLVDDEGEAQAFQWSYPDAVAVPSGGVNSNAVDMANWLKFQLADGQFAGQTLISPKVFELMHSPHTAISEPGAAPDILSQFPDDIREEADMRFWSYGMGWYVTEYRGRRLIYHSGSIDGFRAGVALLPEENLAIYIGVNRTSRLPFPMILRLFDEILGISPKVDWSQRYLALE